MEIKNVGLTKLRNNAHFEFHTEVKNMVLQHGTDKLNVKELFNGYIELIDKEAEGLEIIRQSELTKLLTKSDEDRDSIFLGLLANIKSLTKHFDPSVVESAEKLLPIFNTFGNVARLSYNEETAAVDRLTHELLTDHAPVVKAAGVEAWIIKLQQQNEEFRQLMVQRNEETAVKEPILMRNMRKEIDDVYRSIVKRINASALLQGKENYVDFISQLNNRIDYYKAYNM